MRRYVSHNLVHFNSDDIKRFADVFPASGLRLLLWIKFEFDHEGSLVDLVTHGYSSADIDTAGMSALAQDAHEYLYKGTKPYWSKSYVR